MIMGTMAFIHVYMHVYTHTRVHTHMNTCIWCLQFSGSDADFFVCSVRTIVV